MIEGWKAIAEEIGTSLRTAKRYREKLQEAGVIFYKLKGRPPRRIVMADPKKLKEEWARI